jgi:hypothetical protein
MQIIIDAIPIMMQASVISIAYIMIGLIWMLIRQRLPEPIKYHYNGIQVAAMLLLWPINMIVTAIRYIGNRYL